MSRDGASIFAPFEPARAASNGNCIWKIFDVVLGEIGIIMRIIIHKMRAEIHEHMILHAKQILSRTTIIARICTK